MVRKIIAGLFGFFLLFLIQPNNALATDYFVSPTGSDANNGSYQFPYRMVQTGINGLQPGDTLYMRSGIYNEKIVFPRSGLPNLPITVTGYHEETAVIDGIDLTVNSNDGLVKIMGLSYITLSNFTVQNSGFIGVMASSYFNPLVSTHHLTFSDLTVLNSRDAAIKVVGGSYVTLTNNHTRDSGSSGIGIWRSDNVLVDRNNVINARNLSLERGGHEESITIASTTNFEVSNNDVSLDGIIGYLGNEGIDVKESSRFGKVHHNKIHDFPNQGGAIYIDAWTAGLNSTPTLSDIEVFSNHLWNANGIVVGSERGGTAQNIDIFNNLVVDTGAVGIGISNTGIVTAPNGNGPRKNIHIFNNTIYRARWNGGAGIYIISDNIENVVIQNNIVNFNNWNGEITAAIASILPNVTVENNLVFGRKECSNAFPNCVELSDVNDPINHPNIHDNTTADPKFVNSTNLDFHLLSDSPAINQGVPVGNLLNDYDSVSRPQGAGYDIGAYEFIPTQTHTPTNTPNLTGTPAQIPGDANGDGKVDGIDYIIWLNHFNQNVSGSSNGDFNSDGFVNGVDYLIWLNNY